MSNTTAAPAQAPATAHSQPTTTPPGGGVWAWANGQWVRQDTAPAAAAAAD